MGIRDLLGYGCTGQHVGGVDVVVQVGTIAEAIGLSIKGIYKAILQGHTPTSPGIFLLLYLFSAKTES
jgi:hypothetical protein